MNLVQDRTIQSIDDRVRAICDKYESRLNDYIRNDTTNCTLIIIGEYREDDKWKPAVMSFRFDDVTKGSVRQLSDSPLTYFKTEFWFLLGPNDCYVQALTFANHHISSSLIAGHFGRVEMELGPQNKISMQIARSA